MNIKDLLYKTDKFIPFSLSETWDNTGLIIGDGETPVSGICLALDAAPEVIDQVADLKCNVLITHHPLIFNPISRIDTSSFTGAVIKNAIKNDIAIISLHTNWDKSGLNNVMATALKLKNISTLQPHKKEEERMGVTGDLPQKVNSDDFLKMVMDAWNLSHVIFHDADVKKEFSRVAICGGAASEFWLDALYENADVFITAEVKHHHRLEAVYKGLSIIEADHCEMENFSLSSLAQLLGEITETDVRVINPGIKIKLSSQSKDMRSDNF